MSNCEECNLQFTKQFRVVNLQEHHLPSKQISVLRPFKGSSLRLMSTAELSERPLGFSTNMSLTYPRKMPHVTQILLGEKAAFRSSLICNSWFGLTACILEDLYGKIWSCIYEAVCSNKCVGDKSS